MSGDASINLANYKKELTLEVLNERVRSRSLLPARLLGERVHGAPRLDANANARRDRDLKVELEGWERDPSTLEPDETEDVPAQPIA